MEDNLNQVKVWVSSVLGILTGFWGWMGWLLVLWVLCMVLDYVTGSLAAVKAGEWSSKVAREGIWHKAGMVFTVVLMALADVLLGIVLDKLPVINIPFSGIICPVVLVWYILTEIGSSAENAVAMGAPLPAFVQKGLKKAKDLAEKAGETIIGEDNEEAGTHNGKHGV